jgi:hypothetical protein
VNHCDVGIEAARQGERVIEDALAFAIAADRDQDGANRHP